MGLYGDDIIDVASDLNVSLRASQDKEEAMISLQRARSIMVKDVNTNNNIIELKNYPINYGALNEKPTMEVDSEMNRENWLGDKDKQIFAGSTSIKMFDSTGIVLESKNVSVRIKDPSTGNQAKALSYYPIYWSAIRDAKNNLVCYGTVDDDDYTRYPAFAVMIQQTDGSWKVNNGIYLDTSGTWVKFNSSGPNIGRFTHIKDL